MYMYIISICVLVPDTLTYLYQRHSATPARLTRPPTTRRPVCLLSHEDQDTSVTGHLCHTGVVFAALLSPTHSAGDTSVRRGHTLLAAPRIETPLSLVCREKAFAAPLSLNVDALPDGVPPSAPPRYMFMYKSICVCMYII